MTSPELVTIGWITIDDIVLPSGSYERGMLGGGALYSAVGARVWHDRVGIQTVAGANNVDVVRKQIAEVGIDTRGISAIPGNGLELWLLHESESDKQQVPKLSSATATDMDEGQGTLPDVYASAKGFHIAPQTPQSALANVTTLTSFPSRPKLTLDLLVDSYVEADLYLDLSFMETLTAFLPSREEVQYLWKPNTLLTWARNQASHYSCTVAIKMGDQGSLICGEDGAAHQMLAYPSRVLDTTGAGDAYCGGFLAGLIADRSILECAAMGTVSASYVVEARGALATYFPTSDERTERLEYVLEGVRGYDGH